MTSTLISFINMFLISTITVDITSALYSPKVELRVDINQPGIIVLNCEVSNPRLNTAVYLSCPLLKSDAMCFENCRHSCAGSQRELCPTFDALESINCRRWTRSFDGSMITRFILNRTDVRNNGQWYCMHAGVRSSPFGVEAIAPIKKNPVKPKINERVQNQPNLAKPENLYVKQSSELPKQSMDKDQTEYRFLSNLTHSNIVIPVITVLILSIFVNVAFCIRCLLVRYYLRKKKQHVNKSVGCLEICLCVSHSNKNRIPVTAVYDDVPIQQRYNRGPHQLNAMARSSQPDLSSRRPLTRQFGSANPLNSSVTMFNQMMPNSHLHNGMSASAVLIPAGMTQTGDYIYIVPAAQAANGSAGALRGSRIIYDDVPPECSYDPIPPPQLTHSSSLNSLQHRGSRRITSPHSGPSPLPEETPFLNGESGEPILNGARGPVSHNRENGVPLLNGRAPSRDSIADDGSSTQESNSSGNPNRLMMSRNLLQKADTLLREAGTLLHD